MPNERAILCDNVSSTRIPFGKDDPLRLHLWGPHENVSLCINDIREHLLLDIPPQFQDLIEVATYIYCADQAITRGGNGVETFGKDWRRRLFFRIPVRNPDLWNSSPLKTQLIETLSFLSEDEYHFEFTKLTYQPPAQQPLGLDLPSPDEILLFSGGLDSLGGAVQEAVIDQRKVALVMHRPTQKLARRHKCLQELLKRHSKSAPFHIPVVINKAKSLGREYTQRSRSFLYAALGSAVARMFGLSRLRFYENGIISFNLPPSAQVVGARASRTTHPLVIEGFSRIFSILAEKTFVVENPFLWKTKAEILQIIDKAGCAEMIRSTTSCMHTWEITNLRTHCGTCSQCIDRRFSVLSAGLESHDPQSAYAVDLLVGDQPEDESRTMLAAYVETASEVSKMTAIEFFGRFGEAARVLRHVNGSTDTTALKLFELHKRHAKSISGVIDNAISKHASAIRNRELPDSCLLRLVCDSSVPPYDAVRDFPSAPIIQDECGDFVFRQNGQAWFVKYAGGEGFILLRSKGAAYLSILLSSPRVEFKVTDLVLQVAKNPNQFMLGNGDEATDREALAAYRDKYKELEEQLAEAERYAEQGMAPLISADETRKEMLFLAEQIKKDTGLQNRIRRNGDDRDKVRKSFRAAIRRVTDEIAKYDKRLSEHLRDPRLRCGWSPCYDPQADIHWQI
jgi:7-cyano-7-deazaguanine synthase in queuosine biosynthesis